MRGKWNNRLVEEEFGWGDDWGVGVGVGEGDAECQVRERILRCSVTSGKQIFMIKI